MAVKEGLLALLERGPSHGYRLKADFEAATGGVWPLNVGQVYTTLDRLMRDGLVVSTDGGEQRTYAITDDGIAELGAWWDMVPGEQPPPRDELMVKVLLAVAVDRARALEVITQQRDAVMSLLQRRRRTAGRGGGLGARLVHDALVVRAEADLRWLDLCEERLAEAATDLSADQQPAPQRSRRGRQGGHK